VIINGCAILSARFVTCTDNDAIVQSRPVLQADLERSNTVAGHPLLQSSLTRHKQTQERSHAEKLVSLPSRSLQCS